MSDYFEHKQFENVSYTETGLSNLEFDYCTFTNCDLSNAAVVSSKFNDCVFVNCNLSMTNLTASTLNDVEFKSCKILGVHFGKCNDFIFGVQFTDCMLDYSSFEKRKMSKTCFKKTSLKGVDFAGTDLKQSRFIDCDCSEAIFYNTNLQEANLILAFNYIINPDENSIKKARFSREGLIGLLNKYNIIVE